MTKKRQVTEFSLVKEKTKKKSDKIEISIYNNKSPFKLLGKTTMSYEGLLAIIDDANEKDKKVFLFVK